MMPSCSQRIAPVAVLLLVGEHGAELRGAELEEAGVHARVAARRRVPVAPDRAAERAVQHEHGRPGGLTQTVKLRPRRGDDEPMWQIELVP